MSQGFIFPTLGNLTGDVTSSGLATTLAQKNIDHVCNGRLTLTTAVPVPPTDVTAATRIYFTPYKGNRISLFDGSVWSTMEFAEIYIDIGTLSAGDALLPHDIFVYNNNGTVTLEKQVWASTTARDTSYDLIFQDGVPSKEGALTRHYLGTFMPRSTTTTEDSATYRYLWNYYNRMPRRLMCYEDTSSYTYVDPASNYREANGDSTYGISRFGFVIGWPEECVQAINLQGPIYASANGFVAVGIGLDRANNNDGNGSSACYIIGGAYTGHSVCVFDAPCPIGKHYLARSEWGDQNPGTLTFYGPVGASASGMSGHVWG